MAGFARTILAANDEAVSYFTGSAMRGRLRFGAADELALSELPTILREFRQLYPRINLELTVTQSGTLVRRLAANHLDLIFVNQPADSDRGRLVRRDRLVWVAIEPVQLDPDQPVPVISYHAPSLSRSAAITALEAGGRTWRITCHVLQRAGDYVLLCGRPVGAAAPRARRPRDRHPSPPGRVARRQHRGERARRAR